eukprot:CAMPEP_0181219654 /NCGR_PEP_ID=MMETSP1096-20121128/28403_1 /TAXON_ID=156174 ORGANISM="Chrysochromulina ericina, Strain CCMP281" /NCGR_SAMPLE_ID=MMETSP1096 /ASSEMBLY_ACC=CAM_ASM_000453 /LENGTH=41 /DNA_ID= /DNA_START= /DNA_END= /DNA_ORIENTATION=
MPQRTWEGNSATTLRPDRDTNLLERCPAAFVLRQLVQCNRE